MRTILYVQPRTGFCSRLLVLNEAYQVAKECGARLVIIWKQTGDCNCDYYDAFSKKQFRDIVCRVHQTFEVRDFIGRQKDAAHNREWAEYWKNILMIRNWIYSAIMLRVYRKKKNQFFPYDKRDRKCQAQDYENIKRCLKSGKSCYCMAYEGLSGYEAEGFYDLSAIRFSEASVKEAEAIVQNQPYVGVHIRRTDHVVAIANSHTEDFVNRMKQEIEKDSQVQFFLATDDSKEEERMLQLFGDKIFVQKDRDLRRSSKKGMHNSIIDCLCLSRAQYILGSQRSIFSKVSAELNKIPLYIVNGQNQ